MDVRGPLAREGQQVALRCLQGTALREAPSLAEVLSQDVGFCRGLHARVFFLFFFLFSFSVFFFFFVFFVFFCSFFFSFSFFVFFCSFLFSFCFSPSCSSLSSYSSFSSSLSFFFLLLFLLLRILLLALLPLLSMRMGSLFDLFSADEEVLSCDWRSYKLGSSSPAEVPFLEGVAIRPRLGRFPRPVRFSWGFLVW